MPRSLSTKPVIEVPVSEISPADVVENVEGGKPYKIEVQFVGQEPFSAEGDTMQEALETLQVPTKIMSKGFIRVERDGLKKELFFMPTQMKRMFYPIAADVNAKILEMNLK